MSGYWVVRTYTAGAVGEKTKFFVPGARPDRRSKRKEKAAEKKQAQNEYCAVRRLAREMNANCDDTWDLITLDYSPEGMDRLCREAEKETPDGEETDEQEKLRQAAKRELVNFIRRVQRAAEKEGLVLRICGAITSDMDGDTGESVRLHHHLLCSGGLREILTAKWAKLGKVSWEPLSKQTDYTAIAEYFLRQVRAQKDEKKYTSTRNLVIPQPSDRVAVSDADLRIPKGGELIFRAGYRKGGSQYIRYALPGKPADHIEGGKKDENSMRRVRKRV